MYLYICIYLGKYTSVCICVMWMCVSQGMYVQCLHMSIIRVYKYIYIFVRVSECMYNIYIYIVMF